MNSKLPESKLRICRVAVFIPLRQSFDYLIPDKIDNTLIKTGIRVVVPFGRQIKIGIITHTDIKTSFDHSRLKSIDSVIDTEPLFNQNDLELLEWSARYYHHPIGDVICTALPGLLRKNKAAELPTQTELGLTEQGKKISIEDLKRAPRQFELIKQLQHSGNKQLSTAALSSLGIEWRSCVSGLIKKGLIEKQNKVVRKQPHSNPLSNPLRLTQAQQDALDSVVRNGSSFAVYLLDGVTGSGKTEVYMQLIQQMLNQQKQVLVLLPEIALTPQLEERFCTRFPVSIGLYHSGLSEKIRCAHWLQFQQGITPILLGTRSATFIPIAGTWLDHSR